MYILHKFDYSKIYHIKWATLIGYSVINAIENIVYRENFTPILFPPPFILWSEGVFKTGLIELHIKDYHYVKKMESVQIYKTGRINLRYPQGENKTEWIQSCIFTLPWHSPAMKHKKTVANIFQWKTLVMWRKNWHWFFRLFRGFSLL